MLKSGTHLGFLLLLLAFIAGVSMVVFVQFPGSTLFWREVQNSGHTILFSIITLLFMMMIRPAAMTNSLYGQYLFCAVILVAVAVLAELSQVLTHRAPSLVDVVRNISGILVGTGVYAFFDTRLFTLWRQRWRIGLLAIAVLVLMVSLVPLLTLAVAYEQRSNAFPLISDFQSGWAKKFISLEQADLTKVSATDGSTPAEKQFVSILELRPGIYPGITIAEPFPDWAAYTKLLLELYSPEAEAFDLVIRIHDCRHTHDYYDRFNRVITVIPGNNRYMIPLPDIKHAPQTRMMDMTCISGVMLFASGLEESMIIHLGYMWLE